MNVKIMKWMEILEKLEDKNMNKICRDVECTISHGYDIMNEFIERGWITSKKVGRINDIKLTKKGKKVKMYVKPLIKLVRGD